MTQVWIGETDDAAEGDYVLRPQGDTVEVGRVESGEVCWLQPVPTSTLPDLADADQERLLTAVRGVETAIDNRGG
ncbi:MAG TPA: hypothetical protein VNA20_08335 [Frankiaceae bacterium]|nr:hypothetical protein [Frankiaceae bacterium]